jgi:hypothetical protein
MERLDQSYLHPSIKHPETDMSRPRDSIPGRMHQGSGGRHSTKELSRQFVAF